MTTSFARKMEEKAGEIALLMESESLDLHFTRGRITRLPEWHRTVNGSTNVKPFYSPYWLFEPRPEGVDRVLIGVNPGGVPQSPKADDVHQYRRFLESSESLNSYLDESWGNHEPGDANPQVGIANVFKSLFGEDRWEAALRSTATFNVCPLRTSRSLHIPNAVWEASVKWCLEVIMELRPRSILCLAVLDPNYKPAFRSPWHAIEERFRINRTYTEDVTSDETDGWPALILGGDITGSELRGSKVLGIPHVSHNWDNQKMFSALADYTTSRSAQC